MKRKMKAYAFKVFILTIFVTIVQAKNDAQKSHAKNEDLCLPVSYVKSDVKDKPDLLIVVESLRPNETEYSKKKGICRIKPDKKDKRGKYLGKLDSSLKDFEYDLGTDTIYQSSFNHKLQILKNKKRSDIFEYSDEIFKGRKLVLSVSLDWVTKNLYIARKNEIQIYNVNDNSKSPKTIITFSPQIEDPFVKVFPNEGYLILKTDNALIRYDQDGANPLVLYNQTDDGYTIRTLAPDYHESRVYWMEVRDWQEHRIRYVNLKGEGAAVTFEEYRSYNRTGYREILQVDRKYVYYAKGGKFKNHLIRVGKVDGKIDLEFDVVENSVPRQIVGNFVKVLVLSGNPQVTANEHPCKVNNGDCKGYCVAVPDAKQGLVRGCVDTEVMSFVKKAWNKVKSILGY